MCALTGPGCGTCTVARCVLGDSLSSGSKCRCGQTLEPLFEYLRAFET